MINAISNNIQFLVGDKALCNLAYKINSFGCNRPMLICDDMTYRLGQKKILLHSFDATGLNIAVVDQLIGNIATVADVERILNLFVKNNCDCIITLGRRGAISAGKAVKIMLKDGVNKLDYYSSHKLGAYEVLDAPLFVVPINLAGAGEGLKSARVYQDDSKVFQFETDSAESNVIVIDEVMTDTLPPKAVASYGLYAFACACEACAHCDDNIYFRPYAVTAINILRENLMPSILHNANVKFRTNLMSAVVFAEKAYSYLGSTLLSELSHIISDRYRANYCNVFSLLFARYITMHKYSQELLAELLLPLGGEKAYIECVEEARANRTIEFVEQVFAKVNETVDYQYGLSKFGVDKAHFTAIAEQAIGYLDPDDEEARYTFIMELLEKSFE
ncbi:MAG: iron-containing alcohol dehydrogenase [Clostridia bacterium]